MVMLVKFEGNLKKNTRDTRYLLQFIVILLYLSPLYSTKTSLTVIISLKQLFTRCTKYFCDFCKIYTYTKRIAFSMYILEFV